MRSSHSFLTAAIGAVSFLLLSSGATARFGHRFGPGPTYGGPDLCPERCSVSGPDTGNWSVYANFDRIKHCEEPMLYQFSLYDRVDDEATTHRIQVCSSYGDDFSGKPASTSQRVSVAPIDAKFEVGWTEGSGLIASSVRSLVKQIRLYLNAGHGNKDTPFIMFAQSGQTTIGIYIGHGLLFQSVSESALEALENHLSELQASLPSLAMQLCGPGYDGAHTFGILATSNATFSPAQDAIGTWHNGTCLSFSDSTTLPGQVTFTTPLLSTNGSKPFTPNNGTFASMSNSTLSARSLRPRAQCRTEVVDGGDTCETMAVKCKISPADFTKYNPSSTFCSTLRPKQHVCCSSGDMPDFRPVQNSDGSCASHKVEANENCADLAAARGLTVQEIESFNKNTWGWNGCNLLFLHSVLCLSPGTPPFPPSISNAVCGPQVPGSKPPTGNSDISKMNPCPLNACCNTWGQCGLTNDFCVNTSTGPPGTAKAGTYGCISNCGLGLPRGDGNGGIKIGYFQGYNLKRPCLFQDASQIDTSQYTHIHFAFGLLTPDYEVHVGDASTTIQFSQFTKLRGVKRILSFGGWAFSNDAATNMIFRNGVKAANFMKMATNIANFIKKHDLDGVDIDWEYPGAPDLPGIPGIPNGTPDEGLLYYIFLITLRGMLPGKSVSIAAPASYWYLKQFPIAGISSVVDYIVYMTYDLHGQWDAGNKWSQEGCESGSCLRSQVNLTETLQALSMITKAGVPGRKVVVGVTSYGRSFNMAQAGCWGPDCKFTGDRVNSHATKGRCTDTAGYISNAEIKEIMDSPGRVVRSFVDASHSDILVYDTNQWVSYMSDNTKRVRTSFYAGLGMGGTTDWAVDLQKFHEVPPKTTPSWGMFIELSTAGKDPTNTSQSSTRPTGEWVKYNCGNLFVKDFKDYTPSERWNGLAADSAWDDIKKWWSIHNGETGEEVTTRVFSSSVELVIGAPHGLQCQNIESSSCYTRESCLRAADGQWSGPGGWLILHSFMTIKAMHVNYKAALKEVSTDYATSARRFQNLFAPVPPQKDNFWEFMVVNLATLGALAGAAPFFNNFITRLPYFREAAQREGRLNNIRDITYASIGQSGTIVKDAYRPTDPYGWSSTDSADFATYMGDTIKAWQAGIDKNLKNLFDGSPESLSQLWAIISGGKMIPGKYQDAMPDGIELDDEKAEVLLSKTAYDNASKTIYAYTIPALWQASGQNPFVLNSGRACGEKLPQYLSENTMKVAGECVDGKQYYLVHPDGHARESSDCNGRNEACVPRWTDNKFSALPGVESLNTNSWGGVTKRELILGSLRTQDASPGQMADPENPNTIQAMMANDITAPGFIRLPVCSAERAFEVWDRDGPRAPNYPCEFSSGGIDMCGPSTFVDNTSSASPKINDCLQIIKNIEGDRTTSWLVHLNHRTIASFGSCRFGVQATDSVGNVDYRVGGQDVIDLIKDAVRRHGRDDGTIGASGDMQCVGNIRTQGVRWGIF